jgi:hypothetical protein
MPIHSIRAAAAEGDDSLIQSFNVDSFDLKCLIFANNMGSKKYVFTAHIEALYNKHRL